MKRAKVLACCVGVCVCWAFLLSGCSSQQHYVPQQKNPTLSAPTLGENGNLRVGVNAKSAPFAATSSSTSKIVGIDVDIAAALSDSLGLKLKIVDVGSDPESALKDGKVDIVMGASKSDTTTSFWKSEEYLPTGVTLFAPSGNMTVPTKGSSPKIAAQAPSKSTWPVTNQFGDDSLVAETDLKTAFSDLSGNKAQYVAADLIIGMYAVYTEDFDAVPLALIQQPGGYCVGVQDSNADLKQAISDAVSALNNNGIISVIQQKWLGTSVDMSTLQLTDKAKASNSAK